MRDTVTAIKGMDIDYVIPLHCTGEPFYEMAKAERPSPFRGAWYGPVRPGITPLPRLSRAGCSRVCCAEAISASICCTCCCSREGAMGDLGATDYRAARRRPGSGFTRDRQVAGARYPDTQTYAGAAAGVVTGTNHRASPVNSQLSFEV